jgi:hypothetical protein
MQNAHRRADSVRGNNNVSRVLVLNDPPRQAVAHHGKFEPRVVRHVVDAQVEFESKIEAKLKALLSYCSLKRLVPGAFNVGFDRVNLHRPTMACANSSLVLLTSHLAVVRNPECAYPSTGVPSSPVLGPARCFPPTHMMRFNTRNYGSKLVSRT